MRIARLIFDEATLTSIVHPAIADLQHEVHEAGDDRRRRFVARCRGVWAFSKLTLAVPAAGTSSPISGRAMPGRSWSEDRPFVALLVGFFVVALLVPMLFGWTATALASGLLLAASLRLWHNAHPARLADPSVWHSADINFSAIPVGGNVGGLICMIGCAAILLAGLPAFAWFLAATLAAAVGVAVALSAKHASRRARVVQTRPLLGRA
jgi:predicted outer membrane lipoprotein